MAFFHRIRTKNFTICVETEDIPNCQSNLKRKNGAGVVNLPDFKQNYKSTIFKTVWYWL